MTDPQDLLKYECECIKCGNTFRCSVENEDICPECEERDEWW